MMGAMISFTLMAISGRSLADKLDTFEIMTFRSFIGIAIVLFFAYRAGTISQIRTQYLKLHIVRNIFVLPARIYGLPFYMCRFRKCLCLNFPRLYGWRYVRLCAGRTPDPD